MGSKSIDTLQMRAGWAFIGVKGSNKMSELSRGMMMSVSAGRTWKSSYNRITRNSTSRKTRTKIVRKRVVIRKSQKTGRTVRIRGGKATKGGVKHSIKVESAGFVGGNYARIFHNGKKMKISRAGRGLNIFAWTSSWKPIGGKAYDTFGKTNHGLEKDFAKIPAGSIIAVACKDECSRKLSAGMKKIFTDMGSKEVLKLGMREPWAFIGVKGKSTMSEMRRNR